MKDGATIDGAKRSQSENEEQTSDNKTFNKDISQFIGEDST